MAVPHPDRSEREGASSPDRSPPGAQPVARVERTAETHFGARGWMYVGIAVAVLLAGVVAEKQVWDDSAELHTIMEVSATLLALVVGLLALVCFYAQQKNTYLFIGAGFVGTALFDGYHASVTSSYFEPLLSSPPDVLMTWSWNASRIYLAVHMVMGYWAWQHEDRRGSADRLRRPTVYAGLVLLAAALFALFSFVPLPAVTYRDQFFSRPVEFIAAALFLLALVGYLRKAAWRESYFEHAIVSSLIVGMLAQAAIMARSLVPFDEMFHLAHLFKIVSYATVLIGLLVNIHGVFIRASRDATALGEANAELEHQLEATDRTKEQLKDVHDALLRRTMELTESQVEMLRTLGDIDLARTEALQAKRDLHRANIELTRSNRELDDFAYIASHDLKEPLRGIHNYSIFLLEDYGERLDEDARKKLETLARLSQRMEDLINTLLHFSRVGRLDLATRETDLNEVLGDVLDSIHVTLEEKKIEIRVPAPLPTVVCDRARVGEIFRNLLTNAVKFNDKDERWIEIGWKVADVRAAEEDVEDEDGAAIATGEHPATVATADTDAEAPKVFYVRDNGIGIREKHQGKIFRIFKRIHARSKYGGGTGAGLTIAKKIVERHGGTIWVESVYGEGTTFFFTLEGGINAGVHQGQSKDTTDPDRGG